jgi:large subunit ribosomal protein L29
VKAGEIREKTSSQIQQDLLGAQKEWINLRFQKEIGQLENSSVVQKLKRDIARMKTILRERELLGRP